MDNLNEMLKAIAGESFSKCTIETDGTRAGTTIKVNGKEVPDLKTFSLSFYNDDYPCNVILGFSTSSPAQPGELSKNVYFSLSCPVETDSADASKAEAAGFPMNFDMCKKMGGTTTTVDGQAVCTLKGVKYPQKKTKAKASLVVPAEIPLHLVPRDQGLRNLFSQLK